MIFYRRTTWYGLNYMIKLKGTLLLQMLPAMVLSGGLAGALSAVYDMDDALQLMEKGRFVERALGPLLAKVYRDLKQAEILAFWGEITPLERTTYL